MDKKELIKDYFVAFFAGIYAGLVILFVDRILSLSGLLDWWAAVAILLFIVFAFLMGLIVIVFVISIATKEMIASKK